MSMPRVLVIDDEPKVLRLVRAILEFDGFSVETATDGPRGLALLDRWKPDLVLLDVLLPGDLDGYRLCRLIRKRSSVPIMMLTVKVRENDKIRGFDAGADDYLCKPFSSRELVARIKAILRRTTVTSGASGRQVVVCGDLVVDLDQNRVMVGDTEVLLTATEYRLLAELARNLGGVVPHQELLKRVWGPESQEDTDSLRAYVRRLRLRIEEDPSRPRYLLSRPGIGYMLTTC